MLENQSFKERVKNVIIQCSKNYKSYFIDYEYLICSEAFNNNTYYIIDAHDDNYLHLTGVSTSISAAEFFTKSYNGTLTENDFSFIKKGQTEKSVKGSVRKKINVLPEIMMIFNKETVVEENFEKNQIRCSFAAGTEKLTLGFTMSGKTKPMTLLKGNELNAQKSKKIDLVIRKPSKAEKFNELIYGSIDSLRKYNSAIEDILEDTLIIRKHNII